MAQLSRQQWITIVAALANLTLVLLFPPYDYLSLQHGNFQTFYGFYWALGQHTNLVVNADFLALEIFVILVNAGIAWLLLGNKRAASLRKKKHWCNGILWLVAINLVVMLLFPPFENIGSVSKATLPSFDGFYFVFADNSRRQLVAAILYIEIALLLINAGLLLLFLMEHKPRNLGPREIQDIAQRLRARRH